MCTENRQIRHSSRLTVVTVALLAVIVVSGCGGGFGRQLAQEDLRASLSPQRTYPFVLDGAVLRGDVYVFLDVGADVAERASFTLTGVENTEVLPSGPRRPPFDLIGTDAGDALPWDSRELPNAAYRLEAAVTMRDGTKRTLAAEFAILNATDAGTEGTWQPRPGTSWQWQLTGAIDTSVEADVFNIDLFDVPQEVIDALQRSGRRVICYFSAGTLEPWRADADAFPDEVVGNEMQNWPEYWLDVRQLDLLAPVLLARLDLAAAKGCDAVEPDNVDGYLSDTGFGLTTADLLSFNRFLAVEAHARGLSIGLKNAIELIPDLVDTFDFAVNESCYRWNECHRLQPFIEAEKAVFGAEYEAALEDFCPVTNALALDFILKHRDLGVYRETCQ